MRRCCRANTTSAAIYCEVDGVYTNTAPVDAYRGAGRPEATFVVERLVEVAARETGKDPAEFRRQNFIKSFPHATPVIMTYDAGDYDACLDKALELADYKGLAARKAASAKKRQEARPRLLRLHRGLRHRAERRRSARWAPASACGSWRRCASTRPARSRC